MGGSIQISDTGTFTIKYLAIPPEINSINDTPAIHKLFHNPISFYVAARHKFYQDQENPDTDRLMMEFGAYLAKAVSDLKKILMPTVKPARQVRIRPWT
jgi:hypothetical protein